VTAGELLVVLPATALLVTLAAAAASGDDESVEATGSLASYPLALTFATANRNSIWSLLLGLPFDRALRYHKLFAVVAVGLGCVHGGTGYYSSDDDDGGGVPCRRTFPAWPPCHPLPGSGQYLSGFVLLISMVLTVVTSLHWIRRRWFELFYFSHLALIASVIVAGVLHGGLIGLGVFAYGVDVAARAVLALMANPQSATATALSSGIVRLVFDTRLRHNAGQYVFLAVPKLSIWQWHPFSIASSPSDSQTVLLIKAVGDWTRQLHALAAESDGGSEGVALPVYVDGPYGAPGVDIDGPRHRHFLLISAGVGATPLLGVASDLQNQAKRGRPIAAVNFVWSGKTLAMLDALFEGSVIADGMPGAPASREPRGGDGTTVTAVEAPTADAVTASTVGVLNVALHLTQSEAGVHLPPGVLEGRPDYDRVFADAAAAAATPPELAQTATEIAVMYCGPPNLGVFVRELCTRHSHYGAAGVRFHLHRESFAL